MWKDRLAVRQLAAVLGRTTRNTLVWICDGLALEFSDTKSTVNPGWHQMDAGGSHNSRIDDASDASQ